VYTKKRDSSFSYSPIGRFVPGRGTNLREHRVGGCRKRGGGDPTEPKDKDKTKVQLLPVEGVLKRAGGRGLPSLERGRDETGCLPSGNANPGH